MPVKPNKTDSDHESDPRSNLESRLLHQAELIAKMQNLLFHCRQRMINDSMRNNDPAMDSFFASGPVTSTPLKEDGEDETVAAGIDETDRVVLLQRQLEEEYHEKEKVIAMMGRFKRTLEERILSHRLLEDNWKQKEEEYAVHIARDKELVTNLWRAFQQMKREFFNCRSSTFRDLASMGGELRGVIKQVDVSFHKLHISCCRLYSGQLGDQESEVSHRHDLRSTTHYLYKFSPIFLHNSPFLLGYRCNFKKFC
ncbi:unnamed protein product [Soboliphyme baturini]|uniref:Uncharacterized protein n=1 Tax=Soboliphyme baturini TaxID=241478 RepID=A0A183J6H3_9BILA|nr:unnamed protein product [Soboliphyme baturini]